MLQRAMGKWRSKTAYSRAPDDAAAAPEDALPAPACPAACPSPCPATCPALGADAPLKGGNGALGWEPADTNGRLSNGSAKANGHPPSSDVTHALVPSPDAAPDSLLEDDDRMHCGLGPFAPKWLQVFASKQAFLVIFCIAWVLQGMYYTYFVSVITTIEKLFQIQSKTTGIIMSATEIGQIGSSLLLTYYGGQGHRPRWIAWGMVLFSISSFTCAVPHFVFGRQLIEANDLLYMGVEGDPLRGTGGSNTCSNVPSLNATCDALGDTARLHSKHTTIVLAIFFISLLGVGMGQTAVYTLGIPFIDDNVASRESPLYFAITIGVRILGPALGFLLGALCTRIYADPYSEPNITPTDPRWVGAWWLGLVLVSSLLLLASVAMFAFPKRLHSSRTVPTRPLRRGKKVPSLRDFPKAVKRLLKNDILMFRTASSVLHILPIAGLYTFLPKYLESQFRLPAHEANMISGLGGILVMGLGIIMSGVFILTKKPNARFVAAWIAFTAVAYAVGMGILMFVGCPMDFAGLEAGRTPSFLPPCEANCQCDQKKFAPICGTDQQTYYSACHAGCRGYQPQNDTQDEFPYKDCECIRESMTLLNASLAHQNVNASASVGFCKPPCPNFVWYIILFSFFVFIHSTSEVGSMLLILRCVDPRDKAMALGLIQFAIGLFGNVPCPIVYGTVVDYACMVWEETTCGEKGACWLYDASIFRMFYHGTTGAILLCAFFVDIIVWYKAGNIKFVDDPPNSGPEEELNPIAGRHRSETSV